MTGAPGSADGRAAASDSPPDAAPERRSARILILAGEASGDHHGARVVEAVRKRRPDVEWVGLGGPELESLGVDTMAGVDQLAVMGFAEVLRHLPFFWRLERRVVRELDSGGIDLVLAVDYPGFNLRIAKKARERGIPVVFYIAPQVWAWKAHRAAHLARDADRIAVILPFEPPIFEAEGGNVTFVGHPLMDRSHRPEDDGELKAELAEAYGVDPAAPLLALLPGSRRQELARHLDLFVEAARLLTHRIPDVRPVIAAAPGVDESVLRDTGLPVTRRTRALLSEARIGLVKSGTSTLEAAVAGVPFVMAYRTSRLTWALARRLVKVEHVALANLVADGRVVPEFLQDQATPEALAEALARIEPDGAPRREMLRGLAEIRDALGDPGAADRVADQVLDLLDAGGSISGSSASSGSDPESRATPEADRE